MGDGTFDGYCSPHEVPGIDEPIEMLSVSQAQIFAIAESGSVFTWGLPGDRAYDSSAKIPKPERVGAFFGKKRLQTLACGRKHYVLITLGAFAPFSKLSWDTKCKHIAGVWCHFDIQTYDNRDIACQTGGYVFTSYLTLIEATSKRDNSHEICVEIIRNMNGTYSGRYRCYLAGSYLLNITLDHLGISGNPFSVNVSPGAIYPPTCLVQWSNPLPLVLRPDNKLSITSVLCDKYGNEVPKTQHSEDDEDVCLCYQIVDNNNQIIIKKSTTGCSIVVEIPTHPGAYMVHIGIDGIEGKHAVQKSPFSLVVQKDKTTTEALAALASKTRLIFPSEAIADEEFVISIEMDNELPDDCYYKIHIESTTKSHQLSARALVRWGKTDPLAPIVKIIRDIAKSIESMVIKVAGSYEMTMSIYNENASYDVGNAMINVIANRAAVEFTQLTNWSSSLAEYEDGVVHSSLHLQLHDKCGNLAINYPQDIVIAWIDTTEEVNTNREELIVEKLSNSVLTIFFPQIKNGGSYIITKVTNLWLHIHLNNVPIEYSPFQLAAKTIEVPPPPPVEARKNYDKLLREEATRRRAEGTLRRERAQIREDRERKQKQQNLRRTGGGFTVKFSN
ncbi:hypothetical protein THRCLA_11814 [Thraustotheca clavata]|uniref:Uncharacterized protein n=1 Tax=Thraustotheca clavata TaxID=74557 RepID=A0A1V9Y6K2_9STRA|nr:hypothetical protein THRCLA_11814 [Thraustotheca clavata]